MAGKSWQFFDRVWERIPWRGFQNQCCGCGLVHDINFRRGPGGSLEAQFTVNARATAAVRREQKRKLKK
jgi:hypothetical protein